MVHIFSLYIFDYYKLSWKLQVTCHWGDMSLKCNSAIVSRATENATYYNQSTMTFIGKLRCTQTIYFLIGNKF